RRRRREDDQAGARIDARGYGGVHPRERRRERRRGVFGSRVTKRIEGNQVTLVALVEVSLARGGRTVLVAPVLPPERSTALALASGERLERASSCEPSLF